MSTDPIEPSRIVHRELLPGARNWSFVIRRGYALRLTDLHGGANCSALFYNAHEKLERYNMADTLKAQHTAFLTRGHVCYSDMGRILCSIVADSCGWHDTICGVSNAAMVREPLRRGALPGAPQRLPPQRPRALPDRAGQVGPRAARTWSRTSTSSARWSWTTRAACASCTGHSKPGDSVDLRAEMDTLVVLNTCPHPLDPATRVGAQAGGADHLAGRPGGGGRPLPPELSGERAGLRQHRHLPLPVLRAPP